MSRFATRGKKRFKKIDKNRILALKTACEIAQVPREEKEGLQKNSTTQSLLARSELLLPNLTVIQAKALKFPICL